MDHSLILRSSYFVVVVVLLFNDASDFVMNETPYRCEQRCILEMNQS